MLSRNKVAVSEGAAGSPPFYGDMNNLKNSCSNPKVRSSLTCRCLILKALRKGFSAQRYGGIAQLGEHLLCKQGVNGSIPFTSTTRYTGKSKNKMKELYGAF